eukprot:Opistho-2@32092
MLPTHIRVFALIALTALAGLACADEIKKEVVTLNSDNFQASIASREFAMVNFYADWCRFSQMLAPVFDQAASLLSSDKVMLARVNCEDQAALAQANHITKYPTIKIYRKGQASKREYRGERTVKALDDFIKTQLESGLQIAPTAVDVSNFLDRYRRIVVGFFAEEKEVSNLAIHFDEVADELRDDCQFVRVVTEKTALAAGAPKVPSVVFRETDQSDIVYDGPESKDELKKWASELCHPLVREITFENAEALTEEGLPFLILFHLPDEKKSVTDFTNVIKARFTQLKGTMNFITADAIKFIHPLQHMGKSKADLPVLAIDSFQHMYDFGPFQEVHVDGRLEQFIADFNSGLLHHRFHNGGGGPQQIAAAPPAPQADSNNNNNNNNGGDNNGAGAPAVAAPVAGGDAAPAADAPKEGEAKRNVDGGDAQNAPPNPSPVIPESTFKKLQPSKSRYTMRKK